MQEQILSNIQARVPTCHNLHPSTTTTMLRRLVNRLGFDIVRHPHRNGFEWHLMSVLRHLQIDTVLDVGANHGQYAKKLREAGYTGWIHSFEPVKSIYEDLNATMRADSRWRGYNYALGPSEEKRSLNVAAGDGQASSFLTFNEDGPARWGADHQVARVEEVEVRRLETTIEAIRAAQPSARIYLKLDTQGLDLQVLQSGGEKLGEVLAMQAELSAQHFYEGMLPLGDALNGYRALGFAITGIFPLSRQLDGLTIIEFDVVFRRDISVNECDVYRDESSQLLQRSASRESP